VVQLPPMFKLSVIMVFADQAGPLWLALESFLESLPFWLRWVILATVALGFLLAFLALFALAIRRKP
jgi:hypothetical protein